MSVIRTLMKNSETIFATLSPAEKKRQIETLKYIELVAMQSNIQINEWDVLEVFKAKKGSNKLVTAPKDINKRLFLKNQANKELYQRAALLDVMSKEKVIKSNYKRYVGNTKSYGEQNLANYKYELEQAQKSGDTYRQQHFAKAIKQIEDSLAKTKGANASDIMYKDIGRIVMNGFWKFIGSSGTKLKFITNANIILFDKNVRTKMNLQKDFGILMCIVDIRNMKPTIHAWKDNTLYANHYLHPYVSNHSICFGNAGEAAQDAISNRDLYALMNIVGMVIGTYNGGEGPHVALHTFVNPGNTGRMELIEFTKESKKYYDTLTPIKDPLKEFMQEVGGLKKVGNTLAKTIGSRPEDASDQHNDEDDDYYEEEDEEYDEEEEDDEEPENT